MRKININKKVALGMLTVVLIFAIILVSSFWPFVIDPSKIATKKFLTDELIIMVITIAATISVLFIAQASNASNPNSELAKAKVLFMDSITKITNRTKFFQWIKRVLQPNDKKEMIKTKLERLEIPESVYYLEDSEIKSLIVPQKYNNVFYKALSKEKIKAIFKIKKQMRKITFVDASYYTAVSSILSNKTLSELASSENNKKITTVLFDLLQKLILSLMFSMIVTSLVLDLSGGQGSSAEHWLTFLSRMSALISSSFLGYIVGCKVNDLDAFYILKRVEVHKLYLEDGEFKEIDEAKEEFKQRVLNEEHKLIGQDAHVLEMK